MNSLIRAHPRACYIPETEALMEGADAGGREPTLPLRDPPTWGSVPSYAPASTASCLTAWGTVFCRSQGQ